MTRRPTIGILTGGGDCPGLNAVIRAATKSAIRLGYDCVGFLRGYEGLVDPVSYMPLDAHNTAGILLQGGTILGSTNKGRFTSLVGEGERVGIDPELLARAASTVKQMGITGLICVGGDGSLGIAQQLHQHGLPVVGVPKTIDNDLGGTAFTFGFDSAVATATAAGGRWGRATCFPLARSQPLRPITLSVPINRPVPRWRNEKRWNNESMLT